MQLQYAEMCRGMIITNDALSGGSPTEIARHGVCDVPTQGMHSAS